ncbi:diguanylate cyclase [Alkalimarinus sediminis]|uniref:diguanylate cyclase n=1 Tax=Alkalimarinus sediminis TaxID=1632866 RepID=A0A9E8HJV0_9ALTE|nr:diguanylate cyclase [Alkalimarinus sediminis]UZW74013.1 diguanylate cyclase [Alkalimarinus sediminis]
MTKKHSLPAIYLRLSLGLSTLIVLLVGAALITLNTQQHNEMVEQVSQGISAQLKSAMTQQVDSSVELADSVYHGATKALKAQLALKVRQAHQQASKILKHNPDLPLSRQKELIIDTLRAIRFNDGQGSIFIVDNEGKLQLPPAHPTISKTKSDASAADSSTATSAERQQFITNTLNQVKTQDELYIEGLTPALYSSDPFQTEPTISFYKMLEPLGWVIGTKASTDAFESTAKAQLIEILTKLQANKPIKLFIADENLMLLALPESVNSINETDLDKMLPENKQLVKNLIQLAKNNENRVVEARWLDQSTNSYTPILLYISLEPNWQWLIGSYVTLAEIEQEIGLNKSRLTEQVEEKLLEIAAILIIAYLIAVMIGLMFYRKIRWHFSLFIERLQSAANDNHPVSSDLISIQEFDTLAQTMNEQLNKRAKLQQDLEQLAQKDPLTDLFNRRRMDELISLEVARTKRNKRPFCLVLGDIDHFKSVNDNYGHEVGDQVISAVANILKTSLREQDSIARWGGEEFLIMLPDTAMEQAESVANKIRLLCENHTLSYEDKQVRFTLTFGIEEFDGSTDIKSAIAAADDALYEGKNNGRNIVVCNSR